MAYSVKVNFSNSDNGKSQKEAPLLSSQIHATPILSVGVQTEIAKWNDINLLKVEGYQKCCSILISIMDVQTANMVVVTWRVKMKVMIMTVWIELINFLYILFSSFFFLNLWEQTYSGISPIVFRADPCGHRFHLTRVELSEVQETVFPFLMFFTKIS